MQKEMEKDLLKFIFYYGGLRVMTNDFRFDFYGGQKKLQHFCFQSDFYYGGAKKIYS